MYYAQRSTTFHHDLPPLLHPDHILSAIIAVLADTKLNVALLDCWAALRLEHIHSPSTCPHLVRLIEPAALILAPTAVSPSGEWLEEVAPPVSLPFCGEWACASAIFPTVAQLAYLVHLRVFIVPAVRSRNSTWCLS